MNMLRARLYDFEMKKKEKELKHWGFKIRHRMGDQIRSYVLQPYRLVKDNRTNFETLAQIKF